MNDKKGLKQYLLWSFLIAWVLQITASILYMKGQIGLYQISLSVSMFAPFLAVIITCKGWKNVGFRPKLKGNVIWLLFAWFVPAILGTLGAAIYFLLFPKAFKLSYEAMYAAVSLIAVITFAPWINMFFAVGEEAGWRGYMYPILKERFGITKGRVIGGVIWGIWHWPIMILAGYEYGKEYWGAPVTGPLLFCVITTAMGIILDLSYEKTECIWYPALMHGAINAFAGAPILFTNPEFYNEPLLGPLMVGLIGGFPMILLAVLVSLKKERQS